MAKNYFKKHLDIFAKDKKHRIIIERHDDFYYISEGFTMIRLPAVFYEVFARPVNPLFISLENGQNAARQPSEPLPVIRPDFSECLRKIWESTKAETPAQLSRLIIESDNAAARVVKIDRKIMLYNNDFITAIRQYCGEVKATADRFPVLKWEDEAGTGCIVLGINNAALLDCIREIAAVL